MSREHLFSLNFNQSISGFPEIIFKRIYRLVETQALILRIIATSRLSI